MTDLSNCGACAMPCSTNNITPSCVAGSCSSGVCATGFADCNGDKQKDGCEVNTQTDPANCGGCTIACASGQSCVAGACVIPCGGPGQTCPSGMTCQAGICR
jgi:hypothetical protein